MSKIKAVATRTMPKDLLDYLDSEVFARLLLTTVCGEQLRIPNVLARPAGHFVQQFDPSIEVNGQWGIELTLSKVSVRDGRFFAGALEVMKALLGDAIKTYVPKGRRVQIFCVIATDIPVSGTGSTLFEMEDEVWIDGEA